MKKLITEISNWVAPENYFKDQIILITGSTSGIGRALSLRLASLGATCLLSGRKEIALNSLYDQIIESGWPKPVLVPIDLNVLDLRRVKSLSSEIYQTFGHLDGLVNMAAQLGGREPIITHRPDVWDQVIKVNLTSVFLLTQGLLNLLDKSKCGRILMVSSSVGKKAKAFWGSYGVSKAGIEILSKTLADELEKTSNIKVITVNPGRTATKMRAEAAPAEDPTQLPQPEDVLDLFLWSLSADGAKGHGKSLDSQDILSLRKR